MTTVDVRVAEIAARAEKATPGPWYREYNSVAISGPDEESERSEWDAAEIALCGRPKELRDPRRIADAAFIAHARDDIPFLLSEVRRLRSVVEDAEAERNVACPHWEPGKITMRKGCTACEATYRAGADHE